MIEHALHLGASNLVFSSALALLAWVVQRRGKHPFLAHSLWLLALVKLLTPPLVALPLIPAAQPAPSLPVAPLAGVGSGWVGPLPLGGPTLDPVSASWTWPAASSLLTGVWIFGSLGVLAVSLLRIRRFHRLLRAASEPAPAALQRVADELASRLGLGTTPPVWTTSARLSPLVWWAGTRPGVFVPAELVRDLAPGQLRWVLAHELAHVRRRDHLVRWLEWLACVLFWWNPVAWWARANLRATGELCCDALVLSALAAKPHAYARSLLSVVEFLSPPSLQAPALACAMSSGGPLERRFRMIVSNRPVATPRWLRACAVVCLGLLPLSVVQAEEPDYEAVSDRLLEAVEEGELTAEQAKAMIGALASQRFAERLATLEDHDDDDGEWEELAAHYRKLGLSGDHLGGVVGALEEVGIEDEQLFETLEAMVKLSWMLRKGDVDGEQVEAFNDYFRDELDLGEEQRDRVWGLSKRIAGARGKRMPSEEDMAAAKKKIWAAVKAGKLTEDEAKQKWEAYVRKAKRNAGAGKRMPSEEDMAGVKKKIWAAVKAGKLTEDEAKQKWEAYVREAKGGHDRGDLWAHYRELGVSKADMGEIKRALVGAELEGERLERALQVIVRIAHGLREADAPESMIAMVTAHLTELEFTDEQVEVVLNTARKLAADHPQGRSEDDRAR